MVCVVWVVTIKSFGRGWDTSASIALDAVSCGVLDR